MKGPRVIVKRDEESSVGRGCHLTGAHFVPEMAKIVWAACRTAHPVIVAVVMLTEGYRNIRDARDMHEECRAFDITTRDQRGAIGTEAMYEVMAANMGDLLGPDYDIIVHGEGNNLHIHCEYDPR